MHFPLKLIALSPTSVTRAFEHCLARSAFVPSKAGSPSAPAPHTHVLSIGKLCLAHIVLATLLPAIVLGQTQLKHEVARENLKHYLKQYDSGLFLGMFNSQQDADTRKLKGEINPLTLKEFDVVFAFGMSGDEPWVKAWEAVRVAGDNLHFAPLMTDYEKIRRMNLDTVVAHSNGNDVASTAIKVGFVRARKFVAVAPPAGFRDEAKHLPVESVEIYRTKRDPVAEVLGKKTVLGLLQKVGDLNVGLLRPPGFDGVIVGGELRITLPEPGLGRSRGRTPRVSECVFDSPAYLTGQPHSYHDNAVNIVLKRMYDIDRAMRTADPRLLTDSKREELERGLETYRSAFPRAADQFDKTMRKSRASKGRGQPSSAPAVRSGHEGGIESHPVSVALLSAALGAAARHGASHIKLKDLLLRTGPPGTRAVVFPAKQTLQIGNAVESLAVDFRVDPDDQRTTVAVVLLTKTLRTTYEHDPAVCARFKGYVLKALQPIAVPSPGAAHSASASPWFWYCCAHDEHSGITEHTFHFSAFVSESRRDLRVDSRWIAPQYAPYWRDSGRPGYDYVLNFQVWSSSEAYSRELLLSVLSRLAQTGPAWTVVYANQRQPASPVVFVEAAWLEGDEVCISTWSRLPAARLALFHGTTRVHPEAEDVFFERWEPVYPGRNYLRLPVGRIHNAVLYLEADGFIDKVYVSREVVHHRQGQTVPRRSDHNRGLAASRPKIGISWPQGNANVVVLRDLIDMPNDYRLAISGEVPGYRPGCSIDVSVYTNDWYPQDPDGRNPVVVRNGLWGTRVYLQGQGQHNKHWIRVTLRDQDGREIASQTVGPICRVRP